METINVSFFKNVLSHQAVAVTVSQLLAGIADGRWKQEVEAVRQALTQGDKKLASQHKRMLPYIGFSGIFEGGHKAVQLQAYSGLIVLDYDGIPPTDLPAARTLCWTQPCVAALFITPSAKGLKVVVATTSTAHQHADTFAAVTHHFDTLIGHPSDPSCKDISRGHFVSFDPQAQYRHVTQPWPANPGEQPTQVAAPTPPPPPIPAVHQSPTIPTLPPMGFVRAYLQLYPALEGNRNNQLFRLSCEACKRGIDKQALKAEAIEAMYTTDFDAQEIGMVVNSAYSKIRKSPPKESDSSYQTCIKVHLSQDLPTPPDDDTPEKPHGEALREQTPTLPQAVFDSLPHLLNDALRHTTGDRERDMLLLAIITATSSLLHTVSAYYARKRYWANLYCFIVAPPASNKGVMEYALALCKHYFKEAADNNDKLEQQYNQSVEAHTQACQQNRGKKPTEITSTPPIEPTYYYPHIPTDISKARLLIHLRDNKEKGGLMFDLEADTLTNASKQDYGNFLDFLRKFFQHESTSASFKVNGKPIYVHQPRLSVLLAGTPAQLCRIIPSSEDGLYSRFLYYTHRQAPQWIDVSSGEEESATEAHFHTLSLRLNRMIQFLGASPTRVRLTAQQWKKLNHTFAHLLTQSRFMDKEEFQSSIKRHGLMTLRICMVFTAIDKAAMQMDVAEVYCSDAHFEAALHIATCCLEHSRLLITSIKSSDKELGELQNPYKIAEILKQLNSPFTTAEFVSLAAQHDLPIATAKRVLANAIGVVISKVKRGVYQMMAQVIQ